MLCIDREMIENKGHALAILGLVITLGGVILYYIFTPIHHEYYNNVPGVVHVSDWVFLFPYWVILLPIGAVLLLVSLIFEIRHRFQRKESSEIWE